MMRREPFSSLTRIVFLSVCVVLLSGGHLSGGSLQAPPGMFKDLNDEIVGNAIMVRSKQLFIDDYIIEKASIKSD